MISRAICEAAFREAIVACDPAARVRDALEREPLRRDPVRGRVLGLAIGKAALAMARGAGPVAHGLVVAPRGRVITSPWPARHAAPNEALGGAPISAPVHDLPPGWTLLYAAHPMPDDTSFAAGARVLELVASATADDVVLALISGGASALVEQPRPGVGVDEYRERVRAVMASGAPIHELNRVRTELSAIKGGKLAACSAAPVVTLVVSDVIGDDPRVIGSGPTVGDPLRAGDRVEVVARMASFGEELVAALAARGVDARRLAEPIADDVVVVAERLVAGRLTDAIGAGAIGADIAGAGVAGAGAAGAAALVAWGEPTVRVPEHAGSGGRAQQLALELARRLRGTSRSAFVAGSDGVDGPSPRGAAGAFVDGSTWDGIVALKIDPAAALARCDAGTALDAVGALVFTGPTGINHADVAIIG